MPDDTSLPIYRPVQLDEVLAHKNLRVQRQKAFRRKGLLCLACNLNLAGPHKRSPLSDIFFKLTLKDLLPALEEAGFCLLKSTSIDQAAGLYSLFQLDYLKTRYASYAEALAALKALCVRYEEAYPAHRLLDLDVLDEQGVKQVRPANKVRTCLLCDAPASLCARSRRHNLKEVEDESNRLIERHLLAFYKEQILRAATAAMRREVELSPKPGLVDLCNQGAHQDMDVASFRRSAATLAEYFPAYIRAAEDFWQHGGRIGERGLLTNKPAFESLRQDLKKLGLAAEKASFAVNRGVNCHAGLNYAFAYILPASYLLVQSQLLCLAQSQSSSSVHFSLSAILDLSAQLAQQDYQTWRKVNPFLAGGARKAAAEAYPIIQKFAWPCLWQALELGHGFSEAALLCLLKIISLNEDSNIIRRSSRESLCSVQARAGKIYRRYQQSPGNPEFYVALKNFDQWMIERGLSPGGSADLLALSLFFYELHNATV